MPTGQWLVASDGRRWFFDSGALCLDFGYTGDFGYGVAAWESLGTPADLDVWLTGRFGPPQHASDGSDHAAAIHLRAAITSTARRVSAGASPAPKDVDAINVWAARPPMPLHLAGGTRVPLPASPAQMLASIGRDAVRTFSAVSSSRVRECASADCRLVFLDTSGPGTRRWCSMSRCGGRAKARTHYSRNHHLGSSKGEDA